MPGPLYSCAEAHNIPAQGLRFLYQGEVGGREESPNHHIMKSYKSYFTAPMEITNIYVYMYMYKYIVY